LFGRPVGLIAEQQVSAVAVKGGAELALLIFPINRDSPPLGQNIPPLARRARTVRTASPRPPSFPYPYRVANRLTRVEARGHLPGPFPGRLDHPGLPGVGPGKNLRKGQAGKVAHPCPLSVHDEAWPNRTRPASRAVTLLARAAGPCRAPIRPRV